MKRLVSLIAFLVAFSTFPAFAEESALSVEGAVTVDSAQAKKLFDSGALFVDTRKDSDWEAGRIPDALHLELKSKFSAESLSAEAGKNDPLVCYCNGSECLRSASCSEQAVEWGFSKVFYYRDGFPAWKAAGYPVE